MLTLITFLLMSVTMQRVDSFHFEDVYYTSMENDSLIVTSYDSTVYIHTQYRVKQDIDCTISDSLLTIKSLTTGELVHTKDFEVYHKFRRQW